MAQANRKGERRDSTGSPGAVVNSKSGGTGAVGVVHRTPWSRLWFTLHIASHVLWLQVYLFLGRIYVSFVGGPVTTFHRTVVVAGDDTALGFGDWVTLLSYPGIHRRLNATINVDVNTRPVGRGIFWDALDAGRSGSTTEDWLPERERMAIGEKRAKKWKLIGTRNLFDSLFDPNVGELRDADIIILCFGRYDTCDPEATKRNIVAIVVELLKRNKYVIVSCIPHFPSQCPTPEAVTLFEKRNDAIRRAVEIVQRSVSAERSTAVRLVDSGALQHLPQTAFRFEGKFLSSQGYDVMAREMMEVLRPLMRMVDREKAVLTATPQFSHFR